MRKKCKVISLNIGGYTLYHNGRPTDKPEESDCMLVPQHLYIVSEESIPPGDWLYDEEGDGGLPHIRQNKDNYEYNAGGYYKVLASTDLELTNECECCRFKRLDSSNLCDCSHLPKIPESFIKEYLKNPEDEVVVEYTFDAFIKTGQTPAGEVEGYWTYKPKLKNNHIIISPVEEKMYNREEVVKILTEYWNYAYSNGLIGSLASWIEENLD